MKDLYGVIFLDQDTTLESRNLPNLAIRKLSLGALAVYDTLDAVRDVQHKMNQAVFVYTLSTYDIEDNGASGTRSYGEPNNPENIHIQAYSIAQIKNSFFLPSSTETLSFELPAIILEKKLALLNSLRLLSWFAYGYGIKGKGFGEIFEDSNMLAYVKRIEKSAAEFSNDNEYLKTLDTLNNALSALINRIGIDGDGKALKYSYDAEAQKHLHDSFKQRLSELGLTSSSSKLTQNLSKALLIISLTLATAAILGLAPVELAVVSTVVSLTTGLGFFFYAKNDQGSRCEQAMLEVSTEIHCSLNNK